MKKVNLILLVILILILSIGCSSFDIIAERSISDEEWAEYEKNSKVNINKTFTGTVDEVIDEYILCNEEHSYGEKDEDDDYNEFETVVHKTFATKKNGDEITSYISYDYRGYVFINGTFTENGGSARIPAKITLKEVENKKDTYKVTSCIIAQDGEYYSPSIKRMFPENVQKEFWEEKYYKDIEKELLKNKQNYLKKIARKAKIKDYVETTYLLEDAEDSLSEADWEKLDELVSKFCEKDYPEWIGTREVVKNGKRYIYKSGEKKLGKRKYLITYTKTNDKGKVLEKYKVNIDKADYKIEKVV